MLFATGLLVHSLPGWAIGLGRPAGQQMIGSLLRIEIPLILAPGEAPPSKDCLRIAPIAGSQDKQFFPRDAQLFIETQGTPRILVVSQRPLTEPIIEFALIVGCNEQFAREVLLLADPAQSPTLPSTSPKPAAQTTPPAPAEAAPIRATLPRPKVEPAAAADLGSLTLPTDTTLNALARKRYPTQRATRDEYRRQMIAANPGFFANEAHPGAVVLPKGTILKIPNGLPPVEMQPPSGSTNAASAPVAPRTSTKAKDRLVIGGSGGGANERKFVASGEALAAIERLERMIVEQQLIESRIEESLLVMNQSLLDAQRRFSELQVVQERNARDKQELRSRLDKVDADLKGALGFWQFLILILTSGAVGAGLLILYARLTDRSRTLPDTGAPPPAESPVATDPEATDPEATDPAPMPTTPPAAKQMLTGIAARGTQASPNAPAILRRAPMAGPTSDAGEPAPVPPSQPSTSPVPAAPAAQPKPTKPTAAAASAPPEIMQTFSSGPVIAAPPPTVDHPPAKPKPLPWEKNTDGPAATAQNLTATTPTPVPASAKKHSVKHPARDTKASPNTPAAAPLAARAAPSPAPADDSNQITFELPEIDFGRLPRAKSEAASAPVQSKASSDPAPQAANPEKDPAEPTSANFRSETSASPATPAPDSRLPDIHFAISAMSPLEVTQPPLESTGSDATSTGQVTTAGARAAQPAETAPNVEHLNLITPAVMLHPELAPDELRHTPHAAKLYSGKATIAVAQAIGLSGALATQINKLLPRLPSFDIDAWFEAFDTLRNAGERKAFASLSHLLNEHLNVEPPFWNIDQRAQKSSIVDHFYIMRRLQAVWQADDPELARALLIELLADSRGGTRAGFPEGTAKEIYLLIRLLDELAAH